MHYTVSNDDSTTRYKYTFEDNTSCMFSVSKAGIISIETWEIVPFESICTALNEVTNMVIQEGMIPKINIKNSNKFLNNLAKKCNYRKIPSKGISFSIWTRPNI